MEVKVDSQGEVTHLILVGNIDESGAEELKNRLKQVNPSSTRQVVLDFSGVTHIGSAGIGKLLLFYKSLASYEGKISLVNMPKDIYEGFKAVKLDSIFEMHQAGKG